MNLLKTDPPTRVNDKFISTNRIDATPVVNDVTHALVPPLAKDVTQYAPMFTAGFYSQVALDIVTETVFHYPYPYISEKTLRPLNCKRMFVIVGPPRMLQTLQDRGFLTFADIIDETYDQIEDPEERFLAVTNSIEKFCDLPLEIIKAYYRDNQHKFDHNWRQMKHLRQAEIQKFLAVA